MKKRILFLTALTVMAALFAVVGCKKNPTPISLGTLKVGDIDLNTATSPTNVPVNPTITATFNIDVDATTATAANITLTEDYDTVVVACTIEVSGKTVTVTPNSNLANGALYKLTVTTGLKATNGEALLALSRSFSTVGSFMPSGSVAYWTFDGNANDQNGSYNAITNGVTDITYVTGRKAAAGQAAQFNGTTSLIEIPNGDVLENSTNFSISFWMKCDTTAKRSQFVFGLSAWYGFQFEYNSNIYGNQIGQCKLAAQYAITGGTSASEDLWFDGTGNLGWQGWTFCKDLVTGGGTGVNGLLSMQWAHIVCTYDATTMVGTMYINGQKMKSQDFNNWPDGDPKRSVTGLKWAGTAGNNILAFGFIQDKTSPTVPDDWASYAITTNNHFKGMLDDVAIYHKVLTPALITLMYNSGKP
jgi:hypothetical protein